MNFLPDIKISEYDYSLPKAKIADFPLEKRDESKLLFFNYKAKVIEHYIFKSITELIPSDSLLIINSTKVISARLYMKKNSGGKCELLLVDPIEPTNDPALIMNSFGTCTWKCMIGGRKIKEGTILEYHLPNKLNFTAEILDRNENYGSVKFCWQSGLSFAELINVLGEIPLPPYIERETTEDDKEWYQTIYAKSDGSIAAPTAGLHFTDEVLINLKKMNIKISELLLHVGPGTFLPVSADEVRHHNMHDERFYVNKSTIVYIIKQLNLNKNIIAVGTTSVRTLETLYWLGLALDAKNTINEFNLEQDYPYSHIHKGTKIEAVHSLENILAFLEYNNLEYITGKTKLFIMPGYNYKIVNGIITNFHLPKSTLLLLVAAFIGELEWKKVYDEALLNDYRFLSYGDSSFLFNPK